VIVFSRSSTAALELLGRKAVHAAGVHLPNQASKRAASRGNAGAVRAAIGGGFALLRVADWDEGIAVAPVRRLRSPSAALNAKLTWIGREAGSGARQCLDQLRGERKPPARVAASHRGVAEAIKQGWADAGVCVRLVSDEAGLDFFSVQREAYDLCLAGDSRRDPKLQAIVAAVRSTRYRSTLAELPGYDTAVSGEIATVN
jgi:molybdate-binding protein